MSCQIRKFKVKHVCALTNPGTRINEADTIPVDGNQQHFGELWFSLLLQASKNNAVEAHDVTYQHTFTSKKADPNVGHLQMIFKKATLASF